jgi:hypothetical protein
MQVSNYKVSIPITHVGRRIRCKPVFLDDSLQEIQSQINTRSIIVSPTNTDSTLPLLLLDVKYYSLVLVYSSGRSTLLKDQNKVLTSYHKTSSETIKALLLITLSDIITPSESGLLLGSLPFKKYDASTFFGSKQVYIDIINSDYNLDLDIDDIYITYLYNIYNNTSPENNDIQLLYNNIKSLQITSRIDLDFYDKLLDSNVEIPDIVTRDYISQFVLFSNSGITGSGFINIQLLFQMFELNENIPFIGLGKKYTNGNPIFKLHQSLKNTTSSSDIKTWMVKEIKKQGVVEYKYIPDLLFRIQIDLGIARITPFYLVVSLDQKGSITLSIEMNLKKMSGSFATTLGSQYLRDIPYSQIITIVNQLVEQINKMPVFKSTTRIPAIQQDSLEIKQYSTKFHTNYRINKRLFTEFLQLLPRNKIFQINNVSSDEFVSFVYKPIYMDNAHTTDYPSWNVVVNVYDNKQTMDSSIIQINQASSRDMALNILKIIYIIGKLHAKNHGIFDIDIFQSDTDNIQKLYVQQDIKEIRALGGITDSRGCQKMRSPVAYKHDVDHELKQIEPNSFLKHNNIEYICKKEGFPYIGFTSKGIICCFVKSQLDKPIYLQMTQQQQLNSTQETIVKPSNILVNITLTNGNTFKTHPLKQIIGPSDNGYFYINPDNIYTQITDSNIIRFLDISDINMWLSSISLDNLLVSPPSNDICTRPPNFDLRKGSLDINAVCTDNLFNTFAYTNNGYPCCFKESEIPSNSSRNSEHRKEYIKKSSIILTDGSKGYLSKTSLFGLFLDKIAPNRTFVRIGVKQDNDKLFNIIRLGSRVYPNGKHIISGNEIRQMLVKYLETPFGQSDVFLNLNKGTLASEYKLFDYIKYIMDNTIDTNVSLLLDLICEYFNTLVLIYDMDKNYILCTPNIKFNTSKKNSIIILRYTNHITSSINYELLAEENTYSGISTTFSLNDIIVQTLLHYYSQSCKKIIDNPTRNEFKPPLVLSKLAKILASNGIKILKQVVNAFNQVYIISTPLGLIPIEPTFTINDVPILSTIQLVNNTQMTYSKLKKHAESTAQFLENNGLSSYHLHSKILGSSGIIGIMTSIGTIIPVNSTLQQLDTLVNELPTSTFNWYQGLDELALFESTQPKDNAVLFYNTLSTFQNIFRQIKLEFVKYKDQLASKIGEYKTISESDNTTQDKLQLLCTLIDPIFIQIKQTNQFFNSFFDESHVGGDYNFIFFKELIAKELLQDSINMSMFYGILPNNNVSDNVVQLIEIADIQKFMMEFTTSNTTYIL